MKKVAGALLVASSFIFVAAIGIAMVGVGPTLACFAFGIGTYAAIFFGLNLLTEQQ